MSDNAVPQKSADAPPGIIIELVRDHDVLRVYPLLHAPHSADRDDPAAPQLLHTVDIGPEVQIRRLYPVAPAMAGQERNPSPLQFADNELIRRRTKGGIHPDLLYPFKPLHLVEAAP